MVPARFEAAQHVLPKIVLDGTSEREDLARPKERGVGICVLTTSMHAELLARCEREVSGIGARIGVVVGGGVGIEAGVVNRSAELQAGHRGRYGATDIPMGAVI